MNYITKYVGIFSIISFIFFYDANAKSNKGRLSIGAGYYNFLINGYLEERYGVPGGVYMSSRSRYSVAYNIEYFPLNVTKVFFLGLKLLL